METNSSIRTWTSIHGLPIIALDSTLKLGTVEDFYFEPGEGSVRALRISKGIYGYGSLAANVINTIERDRITVTNSETVIDESHDGRLSQLPLGHSLLTYNVVGENGDRVGVVTNILIQTNPTIALHVAGFEIAKDRNERSRRRTFSADEVTDYERDNIFIIDQVAKKLR
jgi:sporulation protein YlmC with PRC-barrel domain